MQNSRANWKHSQRCHFAPRAAKENENFKTDDGGGIKFIFRARLRWRIWFFRVIQWPLKAHGRSHVTITLLLRSRFERDAERLSQYPRIGDVCSVTSIWLINHYNACHCLLLSSSRDHQWNVSKCLRSHQGARLRSQTSRRVETFFAANSITEIFGQLCSSKFSFKGSLKLFWIWLFYRFSEIFIKYLIWWLGNDVRLLLSGFGAGTCGNREVQHINCYD